MRFLHTADWQLGMKALSVGEAAPKVREERLNAGRRVIEAAKAAGADFILVAGDLFENNAVERTLVQRVADILRSFGKPIFVIPGNHDPLAPGSVWEHPAWRSSGNVRVLAEEAPVEVPGGMLFPCPVRQKQSGRNPVAWIPAEPAGGIRIGMAHGTVEGVLHSEPDYPIPRNAAQQARLDYLALGHWHSFATFAGADGTVRIAYCGTYEPTGFGERDSGKALIVEIPAAGAVPAISPVQTGGLRWITLETGLREPSDIERLRQQVESMDAPERTLVEIRVQGLLSPESHNLLSHIEQILLSRFLYGWLDASELKPSPGDDSWISNLPAGIIQEAARRLSSGAAADARPEIAARALMELYAIAEEVSR